MSDRSLIADAAEARRREAGQPQPDLREQLAEVLALRINGPASDGRGWYRTDEERSDCYAQADAALAVVLPLLDAKQAANDHLDFLRAAVDLIRRADLPSEQILLSLDGPRISIAVNVSDVFAWGCADAEDITPERLPILERAWRDCEAADGGEWIAELYAARVRGMRPQGASYPSSAAVAALFDACGPERPTGLGNPRKPPAPKEPSP
jgi:hypothetical protein